MVFKMDWILISSNKNEVIRVISSLFYGKILQAKKAQKRIPHS